MEGDVSDHGDVGDSIPSTFQSSSPCLRVSAVKPDFSVCARLRKSATMVLNFLERLFPEV